MEQDVQLASSTSASATEPVIPKQRRKWKRYLLVLLVVLAPLLAWRYTRIEPGEPQMHIASAYQAPVYRPGFRYAPCRGTVSGQKRVYWGDLHVHTSYSMDAYGVGTRNDPWDAYAFARGKSLTLADGKTTVKIDRPLDFAAVTDHAEYFGVTTACFDPATRNVWPCLGYRHLSKFNRWLRLGLMGILSRRDLAALKDPKQPMACLRKGVNCQVAMHNTWKHIQAAAQQSYQRCKFTTLIAYEWTATPSGRHVHRNVIFGSAQVPEMPYDYLRYPSVGALWRALQKGCRKQAGCDVIAIPHNTNWSDGLALQTRGASDEDLRLRAYYERLVEIHQAKGNSECLHPYQDDKAGDCDFEISINRMSQSLKRGNWLGLRAPPMTRKRWEKIRSSYVRAALGRGLKSYAASGTKRLNPLQLGIIASTDTHNGTPGAVASKGFQGSHGDLDISAKQRLKSFDALRTNPGGLVAVWAEENTRESIFAALKRRETYGTSGPRIKLKLVQTWAAGGDLCKAGATSGLAQTPMGGVFRATKGQSGPRFVVMAMQDQARLARIDLIKISWQGGKLSTQIIRHRAVQAKGEATLCWDWQDPAFRADAPALWYARVVEVPTMRWSKRECQLYKKCHQYPDANKMVQHRAWTSPIWHLP